MEPFRIHIADEVLDDLRARLRNTRWPDQVPGIGWKQGTDLNWLQQLVSFWADDFDWRAWEKRLNALDQFTSQGIHFIYKRVASGSDPPLILTHGWPGSFLDYLEMLPLLDDFDLVIPSLPGYGFSPRPAQVGINYRYVSERWHQLLSELGYSRYGAAGGKDRSAGSVTIRVNRRALTRRVYIPISEIPVSDDSTQLCRWVIDLYASFDIHSGQFARHWPTCNDVRLRMSRSRRVTVLRFAAHPAGLAA